jgi:hypothetical protein
MEALMPIPDEFRSFAGLFDLALHDERPTEHDLIAFAVEHTTKHQQSVVRSYLGRLLKPEVTGKELQEVWLEAGASLTIPGQAEMRTFLEMIQKELAKR